MQPSQANVVFNTPLGTQPGGQATGTIDTLDGPQPIGPWLPDAGAVITFNAGSNLTPGGSWTIEALEDFTVPAGYTLTLPQSGTLS